MAHVDQLEFASIKTNQAYGGAQPKVTILGLRDGIDTVCRQAVLSLPGLAIVLKYALVRI